MSLSQPSHFLTHGQSSHPPFDQPLLLQFPPPIFLSCLLSENASSSFRLLFLLTSNTHIPDGESLTVLKGRNALFLDPGFSCQLEFIRATSFQAPSDVEAIHPLDRARSRP